MAILERLCRAAPPGDDEDEALIVRDSLQAVIAARAAGVVDIGALFGALLEQLSCLNTEVCDGCIAKARLHAAASRDTEAAVADDQNSGAKASVAEKPRAPACSVCGEAQGPDGQRPHLCSGCRKPGLRYCSKACQRVHWKGGHREECKALQKERAERSAAQGKQE
ncbi:hypothetical protein MNEG_9511 [Monoraphidium neglectum]|uniref:MYND-type domain-containing protein n=1 Tax=Monoraphidium neglectum TaxID=145388 RepID=A0A0D2M4G4_9CHLO|nr:hypothetical protein MNEG_9511 [Monoraphidium neglectum]KIY98449.1 hypothetical protein MNEG_9511 [Monoraphidium neglectum]|eukprot:XP_013897469.1 hypothetical protein MNEG_9511 [Monoraphidium neglectum]